MPPGIDLVIPAYNEAAVLPSLYANLASQVDGEGRPLPRGSWRLVLVDNASTDGTAEVAERLGRDPAHPETAVLLEPKKGVVPARVRGSGFVLRPEERRRFPLVVHADADNLFPPTFLHDVAQHLSTGNVDVVTRLGFHPVDFWRRVPRVTRRHHEEIGTIHFDDETRRELGISEEGSLFTRRILADFGHVPHQCGLAMTKDVFDRAGGYQREIWPDGTELLGEARNLLYRLARGGARLAWTAEPPIALNPRRLLAEPEKLWAGRSYTEGMSDVRDDLTNGAWEALDRLAPDLEFRIMRRNLIQRFILDPCIARPDRLAPNRRYFGDAYDDILRAISDLHASGRAGRYIDVRPLSETLLDRHQPAILDALSSLREKDGAPA
jgi:glycosyltransferase involved in cell wall biosynthesis